MSSTTINNDSNANSASRSAQKSIAVSGATGLVGAALSEQLHDRGDSVYRITRNSRVESMHDLVWNTADGLINPQRLSGLDAVVHLAGENIAEGRWNDVKKARIRSSRVEGTRKLVEQMVRCEQPPQTLVCASAIGFYGDRGDQILTEDSPAGEGFLPAVCREWEEATSAARDAGIRVVNVRIGVVLSSKGGALQKMLLPFKLGVGGKVGSGKQYWSWISLHDLVRILMFAVDRQDLSGPVNAVAPNPVTNLEFTRDLGAVLHRPTVLPMPGFAAKLALGQMAQDLLLASARVSPERLLASGFEFDYAALPEALVHELEPS